MIGARLRSLLRTLVFRTRVEREMDQEWAFHVDARIDDLVAGGVSRAAAERQARREFGDPLRWREQGRDVRGLGLFDALRQDVAYGVRQLRRAPGFTAVAVLTLALGIGANTAIFSVVNAVLLRPLPYPDADQLVKVWSTMAGGGLPRSPSSLPDFREWQEQTRTFQEMGAYHNAPYNWTAADHPERLQGVRVTASIWPLLGARPQLGTTFTSAGERWGAHRVVVLSDGLWRRRFAARGDIVGQTMMLDGESYAIVGVMPRGFQFPNPLTELWTPIAFAPGDSMETRSNHFLEVLGRLKPGVTVSEGLADLSVIADRISRDHTESAGVGVAGAGWREVHVGDVTFTLLLLLGAVGLVALIACANIANLLLARATTRQRELGIRVALGAGRPRLLRQLLTESIILAGLGALVGIGLADVLLRALPMIGASSIPRLAEVSLDAIVLAFTAGLTIVTAVAFGLWPAWHASSVEAGDSMKESARGASSGRASLRARGLLIVAEVSCSLVLLVAAGLLLLSLVRVQQVDPGFRADHLLTMELTLPESRYTPATRVVGFVDQLIERIAALPGVSAAGVTTSLPLGQGEWGKHTTIEGRPIPRTLAEVTVVNYRQVTPGYFAALRARVRQGRLFTADDRAQRPYVAIVNETAARRLWPGANPIGARMTLGPPEALFADEIRREYPGGIDEWRRNFPWLTIVGVVGDLRQNGLEREVNAEVFVPFAQGGGEDASTSFYLAVNTQSDPMLLRDAVQSVVHSLDPQQPVADVLPMEARLAESLARRRFTLILLGGFGATAVVLALVGLYGVLAYAVSQRRKEIGIRAALGAEPYELFRLVAGQGMRLVMIGVLLGLVLAASLSQAIAGLLFDVPAIHPAVYAATAALLLSCSIVACWIPSRRAARVDPIETLREN